MSRLRRWMAVVTVSGLVLAAGAPAAGAPSHAGASREGLRAVNLTTWGNGGWTQDVNKRGDILGSLNSDDGITRPVLWRRYDTPIDLKVPPSAAAGLNNRADVVGEGWLWSRDRVRPLEHPSRLVFAEDINDRGQVVGVLDRTDNDLSRAFLWQDGQFTDLGAPPDMGSYAISINNRGEVLGYLVSPDWSVKRGFVWRDGVMTILSPLGGEQIGLRSINDRGQVVGWSSVAGSEVNHPFLWERGRMVDLLAGHAEESGDAYDINNAGDIVGMVGHRPVLWRGGRKIELAPAGALGYATAVNEHGDAAGTIYLAGPGGEPSVRVFRWRHGRLLLSAPVGGDSYQDVSGLDERGRVVGSVTIHAVENRPVVWIAR